RRMGGGQCRESRHAGERVDCERCAGGDDDQHRDGVRQSRSRCCERTHSSGCMMDEIDKDYWENHWSPATSSGVRELPVNPYLATETAHLHPGTALDAGCGTGAEAIWLAEQGWQVTAADISHT